MSSVAEALKGMNESWAKSAAAYDTTFGGAKVPEGTYMAKLTKCWPKTSQAGNPMIARNFVILDGDNEGAIVFDNLMLSDDPERLAWVRLFIDQCGYESPENFEDLPELLESIQNNDPPLEFKIQIKHNGEYLNVKVLQSPDGSETSGEAVGELGEAAGAENDEEETLRIELLAFGGAQNLDDLTEDMDLATVKKTLGEYVFEEKEMTPDEIELLEKAELGDLIERKKAVAKIPVKGPAKKPEPAAAKKGAIVKKKK